MRGKGDQGLERAGLNAEREGIGGKVSRSEVRKEGERKGGG